MKQIVKIAKYLVAAAISIYLAAFVYVVSFSFSKNIPEHADAILVLGAKVNLDNTPSAPLYRRIAEAADLYAKNKANYIITTGGVGLGSISEAKIGAEVASGLGVPEKNILKEEGSHNTFQNLAEGKKIAAKYNIKSVIVISDRFHVARGVLVAKHFGFAPVYWDFPDSGYYPIKALIRNYARESAAIITYLPKLYFNQELN